MNGLNRTFRWFTAVVCLVAMSAVPALADLKMINPIKTTPATDKNTAVPSVPRSMPDLLPYWSYDPPGSKLFDAKKLTVPSKIIILSY